MNAHPAGPRHAEEIHHGGAPPRPQSPDQLLALAPNVWPRNTVRGDDGVVSIAGVKVTDIADEFGTPVFVIDEDDFRSNTMSQVQAKHPGPGTCPGVGMTMPSSGPGSGARARAPAAAGAAALLRGAARIRGRAAQLADRRAGGGQAERAALRASDRVLPARRSGRG